MNTNTLSLCCVKEPFNNYVTPRGGRRGMLSDALRTVVNTTLKRVTKGGGGGGQKKALRDC